jgi:NADPH-dependent curcumin reductase CurA
MPGDFRMVSAVLGDPGQDEVHLQMLWLSPDPCRLGRMIVLPF